MVTRHIVVHTDRGAAAWLGLIQLCGSASDVDDGIVRESSDVPVCRRSSVRCMAAEESDATRVQISNPGQREPSCPSQPDLRFDDKRMRALHAGAEITPSLGLESDAIVTPSE